MVGSCSLLDRISAAPTPVPKGELQRDLLVANSPPSSTISSSSPPPWLSAGSSPRSPVPAPAVPGLPSPDVAGAGGGSAATAPGAGGGQGRCGRAGPGRGSPPSSPPRHPQVPPGEARRGGGAAGCRLSPRGRRIGQVGAAERGRDRSGGQLVPPGEAGRGLGRCGGSLPWLPASSAGGDSDASHGGTPLPSRGCVAGLGLGWLEGFFFFAFFFIFSFFGGGVGKRAGGGAINLQSRDGAAETLLPRLAGPGASSPPALPSPGSR